MKAFLVIFTIGVVSAQHGHHGGNYHLDSQTHIDTEIQNHFGKHQCLDLLMVDCQQHVTNGDEMVCGSDGVTYPNQCLKRVPCVTYLCQDNSSRELNKLFS
ncbi:uncharacterized protein [Magallana gigas]|uniref:uncharacterized protein n=1 Tax=Magallana gigas TaxID=29159 RepID=UPI00334041AE